MLKKFQSICNTEVELNVFNDFKSKIDTCSQVKLHTNTCCEISFPRGSYSTSDKYLKPVWRGVFETVSLKSGYDHLRLQYRVKFRDNFDFVRGGKLPGLAGGVDASGGKRPLNGEGFSLRPMWRENGQSELYLYCMNMRNNEWGDSCGRGVVDFSTNEKTLIDLEVKLNSLNAFDGEAKMAINNYLVVHEMNLQFRKDCNLLIDSIKFDAFFGGNEISFASKGDVLEISDAKVFYSG